MRGLNYQQFAIVQGNTAQQLTNRLNRKLYELRNSDPSVTFDGLTARISYYVTDTEDNPLETVFESSGLKLKCKDCPLFEPLKKRDGTPDRRTSFGLCRFAAEGQTLASSKACKKLFEMINDKEVKLCLAED